MGDTENKIIQVDARVSRISGTIENPGEFNCSPGQVNGDRRNYCIPEVYFHQWYDKAGFNLATAQRYCAEKGWALATAEELRKYWELGYSPFKAYGGTEGRPLAQLSVNSQVFSTNSPIQVSYANGPGNAKDWVGIYRKGDTPGKEKATTWQYTSTPSGTLEFSLVEEGAYFITFFKEDGYEEMAGRVEITVAGAQLPFAYGMLAGGNFAIPVQQDYALFKRGLNLGATGGNDGFFYVLASAVGKTQSARDIEKYEALEAMYRYGSSTGPDILFRGWLDSNYFPILDRALKKYIAEKFPRRFADDSYLYQYLVKQIRQGEWDQLNVQYARYEFLGFFVGEYLDMLRKGTNPELQQQFAEYMGYKLASGSRWCLKNWQIFLREHFGKTLDSVNGKQESYQNNRTFTNLVPDDPDSPDSSDSTNYSNEEGERVFPADKSMAKFAKLNIRSSPFFLEYLQIKQLLDFMVPLFAHANPDAAEEMESVLAVPDYLYNNLERQSHLIAAAGGEEMDVFGLTAILMNISSIEIMQIDNIPSTFSDLFLKQSWSRVVELASQSFIDPILAGQAMFAVRFRDSSGKEMKKEVFDKRLKADCYYQPVNINWNKASKSELMYAFAWLFKMIMDSWFSIAPPTKKADTDMQKAIEYLAVEWGKENLASKSALYDQVLASMHERYSKKLVRFHAQNSLTLAEAQELAKRYSGALATEAEVRKAWQNGSLDVFAYGMMADGRIAVPVQTDRSNENVAFKKGPNIGVTGGNQGFFYTV